MTNILPFVDIETTGLDPEKNIILEVGIDLRDSDTLESIAYFESVIRQTAGVIGYQSTHAPEIVREMHTANGLWNDCINSEHSLMTAEVTLIGFLDKYSAIGLPMVGSSLALDRAFLDRWMPDLHKLFHYRSIDNSSTKELCRRYAPKLFDTLPVTQTDHRVRNCLTGTIEEFKFYRDNFLLCEEN